MGKMSMVATFCFLMSMLTHYMQTNLCYLGAVLNDVLHSAASAITMDMSTCHLMSL